MSAEARLHESAAPLAQELVRLIVEAQWDEIARQFDPTLAAALSRDQLAATWAQVELDAGRLIRSEPPLIAEKDGLAIATSRLVFERAELNLHAVFNCDLTIAGLTLRPVEPAG